MLPLSEKSQKLSDIQLAILLSLVAGEHCIIHTEDEYLDPLKDELRLVGFIVRRNPTSTIAENDKGCEQYLRLVSRISAVRRLHHGG